MLFCYLLYKLLYKYMWQFWNEELNFILIVHKKRYKIPYLSIHQAILGLQKE